MSWLWLLLPLGFILGWITCALLTNAACSDCRDAMRYMNGLGEK